MKISKARFGGTIGFFAFYLLIGSLAHAYPNLSEAPLDQYNRTPLGQFTYDMGDCESSTQSIASITAAATENCKQNGASRGDTSFSETLYSYTTQYGVQDVVFSCRLTETPFYYIVSFTCSLPKPSIDLSVGALSFSQPPGTPVKTDTTGAVILTPGQPAQAQITVSGAGISPTDARSTTVGLNVNGQTFTAVVALSQIAGKSQVFAIPFTPVGSGIQPVSASVDGNNSLNETNTSNNTSPTQQINVAAPSIIVVGMRVAQVVYNPSIHSDSSTIDLVQGKSASFEVTLAGTSLSSLTDTVNIQILANGQPLITTSKPIAVNAIAPAGNLSPNYVLTPDKFPSFQVPVSASPIRYTAQVLAIASTSTTTIAINQLQSPLVANPKLTYSPTIGLVPISGCVFSTGLNCYSSVAQPDMNYLLSLQSYISDVFPFSDNSVKLSQLTDTFKGSNRVFPPQKSGDLCPPVQVTEGDNILLDPGVAADFEQLHIIRTKNSSNQILSRAIGVVPPDYFDRHCLSGYVGMTATKNPNNSNATMSKVSLVSTNAGGDAVGVLPHELSHTYGVLDDADYLRGRVYVASGYNANPAKSTLYTDPTHNLYPSITTETGLKTDQASYWVNANRYTQWFATASKIDLDPKVIYFGGLLNPDGTFTVLDAGISETGALSNDESGDLTIRALNSSGAVLSSITVTSNIVPILAPKASTIAAASYSFTSVPIFTTLPFDTAAQTVQVLKNSVVIANQRLVQLTLAQLLAEIPNAGFKTNPVLERFVLALQIAAIQTAIDKNKIQLARSGLSLIKEELELTLKDSHPVAVQNQLTKAQAIAEITRIAQGLK